LANETLTHDERGRVIRYWGDLVQHVKPDQGYMPISPVELAKMRSELEAQGLAVRVLLAAIADAKARRPIHFRVVEAGGR
jgi:hypothetical protein